MAPAVPGDQFLHLDIMRQQMSLVAKIPRLGLQGQQIGVVG